MTHLRSTLFLALSIAAVSCSSDSNPDDKNPSGSAGATAGSGGKSSGTGGTSAGSAGRANGTGGSGVAGSGGSSASSGGTAGGGGASGEAGSASKVTCGSSKAKVPTLGSTEGVVIAPDGTIYHSQSFEGAFIGRIRPGMDHEKNWVNVGEQVLGITYDPKRKALYAGSRARKKILKIEVDQADPDDIEFADAEAGVNGLTLGEDDAVYYNDQTGGHVYRVAPDGKKTTVTNSAMPNEPNGLAFGPDGWLYVNQWDGEEVWRLQLDADGKEIERERFIEKVGANKADGIAFDELGRLYLTAGGKLHQFDKDGKFIKSMDSNGANLDFGVGSLSCTDLYVGGNGGGLVVHTLDAKGMDVPWHRAP